MIDIKNGDCYKIIPEIKDKSINLIVTDPPYQFQKSIGGGLFSKEKGHHELKELIELKCDTFEPEVFLDMLLPKMVTFCGYFCCNKFLVARYIEWAEKRNFTYDILTLLKSNPIPAKRGHHLTDTEYIIFIREKGSYFSEHKDLDDFRKYFIINCNGKRLHPAEKPVALFERFIRVSSKENDVILDPFLGSGTTAIACKRNNRNCIGIEMSEKYFNLAKERVDGELKQGVLF